MDGNLVEHGQVPGLAAAPAAPGKRAVWLVALVLAGVAALVLGAAYMWRTAENYVSTDDAYVDGHVSAIAPQIAGRVVALPVADNQDVARGQTLLRIDPADARIKLEQAVAQTAQGAAQLHQAQAQITLQRASIGQAEAQIRIDAALLAQAEQDLRRYKSIDSHAVARQQIDTAVASFASAQARLDSSRHALQAAHAQLAAQQAAVENAQAVLAFDESAVRNAQMQLSYTTITAPAAGRITKRSAELGNYVTPGQIVLYVVPYGMWVTANFKETQLARIHPGQKVDVRIDAIGGKIFTGQVDSFQTGSGSVFSTLPAENATGNYVKVVQRIPVKITLDDANDPRLAPGLSAVPSVHVQ